jgi:hypothetical protein
MIVIPEAPRRQDAPAKCGHCGSQLAFSDLHCQQCKAPISPIRRLTEAEVKELKQFALDLEDQLYHSTSRLNRYVASSFVGFIVATALTYFGLENYLDSFFKAVVFTAAVGITLFVVFGYVADWAKENSLRKTYAHQVAEEIGDKLEAMHIYRYEFDHLAVDTLPKDAIMRRFLFVKQSRA